MNRLISKIELTILFLLTIFIIPLWHQSSVTRAQDNTPSIAEETAYIASVQELSSGLIVADVGAGGGKHFAFLADEVGANGMVYSTEIAPANIVGKHENMQLSKRIS